ncbi:hypothetical protein [Legionella gresilensis]|uniref:hypothetical protein n=1 Tax=Legionella gresilensis TaxID=91823 RepID=UPI0010410854|nr:hypothetical protein [Legionella gresilensis]
MKWYIEALEPVLNKIVFEQREEAEQFLKVCLDIFYTLDNNPELEFYLGPIEKLHKKFANYKNDSVSLKEFATYLLPLLIVYTKVTNDSRVWNNDFMDYLNEIIPLTHEKSFLREVSIKALEQWERSFLKELNYNVQVDEDEAIRLVKPYEADLPQSLRAYITFKQEQTIQSNNQQFDIKSPNKSFEEIEFHFTENELKQGLETILGRHRQQPIIENFIELIKYCFNQTIESPQIKHRLPFFQTLVSDEARAAKHLVEALRNKDQSNFTAKDKEALMSNIRLVLTIKDALEYLEEDYLDQLKNDLNMTQTLKSLNQLTEVLMNEESNHMLKVIN